MGTIPLVLLLAGAWAYCLLQIAAVRRYLAVRPPPLREAEPVSILKPLHGVDEGLEENLRSFFRQDYPAFEILFAARSAADACWAVVEKLRGEFPRVPVRTFVTGEPPYPNAKVWSLDRMMGAAAHDLVVMSDSDIRVTPEMLQTIAAEFQDPRLGVATCPYRAVPGRSFWSRLEAIGMNTEFWGGVLTARLVEGGVKFAVGPTIAARRRVLEAIGGFALLSEYLAEDFVMGQRAAEAGYGVILSSFVIEHRIGAQPMAANFAHRLRWSRSTRRSRPAGYAGQVFTNPLPIALLLAAVSPEWWPALAGTVILRYWAAYAVFGKVLHDRLCRNRFYEIPVQDMVSFAFWVAGFFGNTIVWRGIRYRLRSDGKFERA
jgi:ceramide glucosyltransferase